MARALRRGKSIHSNAFQNAGQSSVWVCLWFCYWMELA